MDLFVKKKERVEAPSNLSDIIGNHIGAYEHSEHKQRAHSFGRKTAIACAASMALMIGGLYGNEHYNANRNEYNNRIAQAINEHASNRMPANPSLAGYMGLYNND
ncbi:MAG: hypothetical protein ACMXYL_03280 [Candidatus Woesearchaeota archaeon]